MVKQELDRIIRDFFKFHNQKVNDLKYMFNSVVPVVTLSGKKTLQGFRNIIHEVSVSNNDEQKAILDEWAEYMQVNMNHFDSSNVLKVESFVKHMELNKYLLDKVYFIGNQIGSIDILMYYLLYSVFLNLTFQEKEKYMNVSRWFNHVQHSSDSRMWRSVIQFSRCHLYA